MARDAGSTDETTDPTDDTPENGNGTSAEDAFEAELTETIGDALSDDDDDDGGAAGADDDDADLLDVDDAGNDDDDDEDEDDDDKPAGQARDEKGKFAKADDKADDAKVGDTKAGDSAAGKVAADAKPDAGAAAADDKKPADKTAEPVWEPLEVKAGNESVKIDEAKISRFNGHLWAVVPEAQANRFIQRLSRGAQYERVSRQLDQERRELEARKNAPPQKSESEIEAEIVLEAVKPYLKEIFDENGAQLLDLRIENAKMKHRNDFAAAEQARLAKAAETPWEDVQVDLLDEVLQRMLTHPELAGLSPDVVEAIKQAEFLPVKNALIFKENDQPVGNTEFIFERLKRARAAAGATAGATTGSAASTAATKAAPAADATKPASSETSAKADTSQSTATKKPVDQAERFNRGADSAAKPSTTSVKANRDRPSDQRAPRDAKDKTGRRRTRNERADAEDKVRAASRRFMNSPGFDFDEDDDGDEE